jgi:hypothetical protein
MYMTNTAPSYPPKVPSQQAIEIAARLMALELVRRRGMARRVAGEVPALPISENQQRQDKV